MNVYVYIFDTIFLQIFEISSCDRKSRLNHILEIGWNKLESGWDESLSEYTENIQEEERGSVNRAVVDVVRCDQPLPGFVSFRDWIVIEHPLGIIWYIAGRINNHKHCALTAV